jgi:hypothetical protein
LLAVMTVPDGTTVIRTVAGVGVVLAVITQR